MTTESTVAHSAAGAAPQNVSSAKKKYLSVAQGIALIYGTNIGAGVLSLPYAARNGGFLALVVALLIAGTLTTISMLYIAEVSLRTKKPLQLSGLAEEYLGQWGRWLVFIAIVVNSVGALIAYASGSGILIGNLTGLPPIVGTLGFFVLGTLIMWKGLHTASFVEGIDHHWHGNDHHRAVWMDSAWSWNFRRQPDRVPPILHRSDHEPRGLYLPCPICGSRNRTRS